MIKQELPIPIYRLAMLQAYLYEIFGSEKKCAKNFKYTEWYLIENYSEEKVKEIIKFFKEEGLNCDCGILKKIDLRELAEGKIAFH